VAFFYCSTQKAEVGIAGPLWRDKNRSDTQKYAQMALNKIRANANKQQSQKSKRTTPSNSGQPTTCPAGNWVQNLKGTRP